MTAPHVLSPEEWDAQQRPLSPDEWEMAQRAKAALGRGALPLPSASADVTREVGGVVDPEAWKTTIHKPGFIERNITGAIGLPFAAAAHPIETVGAMLKAAATDPFKPGMYAAKKLNEAVGLPAPSDRFNVSGEEAAQSALNTALMVAPALLKAVRGAPVEAPVEAAPVRVPREGIGRIPAADVVPRTAPVSGLAELLDRLREPQATTGDVPANVPFPPAQRAYPFGATTGDLLEGGVRKPFREPLPTPYTREGVVRRPASDVPSPQEWEAAQSAPEPSAPTPAPLRPTPRPTLGPPKVTVEMMLEMGKRRAAELEKSPEAPDLTAAMEAHGVEVPKAAELPAGSPEVVSVGRDLAEPGRLPTDMPSVPRPRGTEPSGVMQTPEGVVSAGPKTVPERTTTEAVAEPPAPEVPKEAPNPIVAPRDYLNYAKFGLDRTTEARLRSTVDALRKTGDVDKGYQSFAEQQKAATAFAKELAQNPLDIDPAKLSKLSGADIVGLRTVASENTRLVEGLSKAIESGELNAAELADAHALLDRAVTSTNEVLGAVVRETAQKARDLGFLRQVAKLTTDPDVWVVRAKKMMGDRPLSDTMMVEIRKLAREAAEACG